MKLIASTIGQHLPDQQPWRVFAFERVMGTTAVTVINLENSNNQLVSRTKDERKRGKAQDTTVLSKGLVTVLNISEIY